MIDLAVLIGINVLRYKDLFTPNEFIFALLLWYIAVKVGGAQYYLYEKKAE